MSYSDKTIIKIYNIEKRYEIYTKPFERLKQFVLPRLCSLFGFNTKQYFREFWALKGVSFEIKKGDTVAIIGVNGSGKSTLLQIICGTLNPTSGSIQLNGRIAALLELGSGFDHECTGRENVYLNGSLLGLTIDEIHNRFEGILEFSGIGSFIDQPIKTYSSGMILRLAFSVIAHVDADVLIIDEALAVGDISFQAKCFEKLGEMKRNGVTLLLVSHDTNLLRSISDRALWLQEGVIMMDDKPSLVLDEYIKSQHIQINKYLDANSAGEGTQGVYGNNKALISDIQLFDWEKKLVNYLVSGKNYTIKFSAFFYEDMKNVVFGFGIKNLAGLQVIGMHSSNFLDEGFEFKKNKKYCFEINFNNILNQGSYILQINLEKIYSLNRVHEFISVVEKAMLLECVLERDAKRNFHSLVWVNSTFHTYES